MSWSEWESDAYGPITLFYIGGGIQLSTDGDKFHISITAQWCGVQVPEIDSETAERLLSAWKRRQEKSL